MRAALFACTPRRNIRSIWDSAVTRRRNGRTAGDFVSNLQKVDFDTKRGANRKVVLYSIPFLGKRVQGFPKNLVLESRI